MAVSLQSLSLGDQIRYRPSGQSKGTTIWGGGGEVGEEGGLSTA